PRPAGVPARPYMGLDKTGEQEIFDAIRKRVSAALRQ
ncbi:phage virion morphogenesis protein, partial [Salmonella enterica]|nr:phage virion morphogenesis protein [Salmonella enterica]